MRWPATATPHLLINLSTAGGLEPVGRGYIHAAVHGLGIAAQDLRADRLHDEAQASGGDPLQLTHLFGFSDPTANPLLVDMPVIVRHINHYAEPKGELSLITGIMCRSGRHRPARDPAGT